LQVFDASACQLLADLFADFLVHENLMVNITVGFGLRLWLRMCFVFIGFLRHYAQCLLALCCFLHGLTGNFIFVDCMSYFFPI